MPAFVTARLLAPKSDLLKVFRALQRSFYVDALDTTNGSVLAEVGAAALTDVGHSTTADEFLKAWQRPRTIVAAQKDFQRTRELGLTSFPTLFIERERKLQRVGNGYTQVDALERELGL